MLNKVILIGNLGKDPEVRTFDSGNSIATFTLATNETYKDRNGEKQTRTDWHNIHIWNQNQVKLAQQYLKKGDSVYIEGQIRTREYEKEGQKRYITEIHVESIRFLPRKSNDGKPNPEESSGSPSSIKENAISSSGANDFISPFDEGNNNDDLPF